MKKQSILIFPAILFFLLLVNEYFNGSATAGEAEETLLYKASAMPAFKFSYLPVKDTIYVLGDAYIELCLKTQIARLYIRDGDTVEFPISSGTSGISKGIDTPEGIYTVQSKSPKAVSKQFNNAELFNWIGFSGNVGFHGLKGNGYYSYLGARPSSHGCVRISREDGEKLYRKVRLGTPIMAYNEEPAFAFRFANVTEFSAVSDILLVSRNKGTERLLDRRLNNFYQGKANLKNYGRLFIDGATVLRPGGYKVGRNEKIARKQDIFIPESRLHYEKQDLSAVSAKSQINYSEN